MRPDGYRCVIESKPPDGNFAPWHHVAEMLWKYTQRSDEYGILDMSGTAMLGIGLHGFLQMKSAIHGMRRGDRFIERAVVAFRRLLRRPARRIDSAAAPSVR